MLASYIKKIKIAILATVKHLHKSCKITMQASHIKFVK